MLQFFAGVLATLGTLLVIGYFMDRYGRRRLTIGIAPT